MRHNAMSSIPVWTVVLGLAALGVHGSAGAQTRELATQGDLLDRVVAIVNDGVVLNSDLDAQLDIVSVRLLRFATSCNAAFSISSDTFTPA